MKAIYINIDPYLQAVADWINAGKPGTAPSFEPLPVAVTLPLGESACIYRVGDSGTAYAGFLVDGIALFVRDGDNSADGAIRYDINLGFSKFGAASGEVPVDTQYYAAWSVSADTSSTFVVEDADGNELATFTIPVLVRRETASGPVDLVDFAPPLSLAGVSFAGVDIEGAEFDGNEIVADADTGALSAPAAGG